MWRVPGLLDPDSRVGTEILPLDLSFGILRELGCRLRPMSCFWEAQRGSITRHHRLPDDHIRGLLQPTFAAMREDSCMQNVPLNPRSDIFLNADFFGSSERCVGV